MRIILIAIGFLLTFGSCRDTPKTYSMTILDQEGVHPGFASQIDEPGRMLVGWYLFAYGNECNQDNDKPKCQILDLLDIQNECDTLYIQTLQSWFAKDVYRSIKLKKCPSLPAKGAIQNEFKYLSIKRVQDTLAISFQVDGMNNSQEKSWNTKRTERFLLETGCFIFLDN